MFVICIVWFSEDRLFVVGYFDGKLLLGIKELFEKGGIVLIDVYKDIFISMKWDFIGYIFMICVKEDSVKFWSFILGCWCCLYLFCYFFIVNGIVWCCFLGKGFKL